MTRQTEKWSGRKRFRRCFWLLYWLFALVYMVMATQFELLSDYEKDLIFIVHPEKGVHGSLSAPDSLIPIIFAGPDVTEKPVNDARLIDAAPTIASLFGLKLPTADGKPLF
ncbi:MAG: hypothetical protein ABIH66_09870 [bacterium]